MRKRAREATHIYIEQIDEIARHMLGLPLTPKTVAENEDAEVSNEGE